MPLVKTEKAPRRPRQRPGDPRIALFREAALRMRRGDFKVELPAHTEDELGQLGQALRELGAALEQKFHEISTLAQVTERINSGFMLDQVLDFVYDSFHTILPYDRIGFSLLESEGEVLHAHWARSSASDIRIYKGYQAEMRGSSLLEVLRTGRPRILNDLEQYLRDHPQSDSTHRIVDEGMRSSLTCPLVALGKPIGFMFFSSTQTGCYRDVHVELFSQLAGQLAVIVEKGRAYQQLLELNELKNKFLGIAVHDLRNPISTIRGLVYVLKGHFLGAVPRQQQEVLDRIDGTCENMLGLINELLDVSAIESGRLQLELDQLELAGLVQSCAENNEMLARAKSMELVLDLPPDLPSVVVDIHRIQQALDNLISNAIKYSHPGTTIRLGASTVGDHFQISVSDQGQGIPADELPKLFTDFGRTSVRPTGGEKSTGLGLAIVKRLVAAHEGRVTVHSEVGVGSTFTLTLPVTGPRVPAGQT